MLNSFSKSFPPQEGQAAPGGTSEASSLVNQALEPSAAKILATWRQTPASASGWPQDLHLKAGMGTPQERWREMHQSGRPATMPSIRSLPHSGIQQTRAMAWRAFSRRPSLSMEMNHCSVARNMTGFLQRQQWGYECEIRVSLSSVPSRFMSAVMR